MGVRCYLKFENLRGFRYHDDSITLNIGGYDLLAAFDPGY